MKIVVYTALFGPAESLPPPAFINPDVQYVCFTDRPCDVPQGWECRIRQVPNGDYRRAARIVKTADGRLFGRKRATVWMDASFDLLRDPIDIVHDAEVLDCPIVGFSHPDRSTIAHEARAIIAAGLAPEAAVTDQVTEYLRLSQRFVDQRSVLTTTGFLIRFQGENVDNFNTLWWMHQDHYTLRDQLSVDIVAQLTGVQIGHLPGHYRDNIYVHYNRERHLQRRVAS